MMRLHAEKTDVGVVLVATDGRRMHIVEYDNNNAPAAVIGMQGNYDVVSNTQKAIILELSDATDFPNWKRVMPTNDKHFLLDLPKTSKSYSRMNFSQGVFSLQQTTGACFDLDYLKDLADDGMYGEYTVGFTAPNNAIEPLV
ncbi:MAG: hypothetical protein Ta2A_09170 [Treponemataceae bacterium]|nr:MAG: hypothetical protein Ta2A_09170 [Treponemataceae bacterium]